jgi:hypothetical protein
MDGNFLDVEHDVGHILAYPRNRRKFVKDAIDLDSGDGCPLQ